MKLKSSTDYAIRIVCYLATHNGMISTTELSKQLYIASTYIPKVAKKLKDANIIVACEGVNGGYTLAKRAEDISLKEIVSCMEETMAINRCLERDGFCSRNAVNHCRVHKVLLDVQNTFNNKLENIKVSDLIRPGKDEYFGRFYVVLKVNLKKNSYECVYSHNQDVYDQSEIIDSYDEFIKNYVNWFVYESDQEKIESFLLLNELKKVDSCIEEDLPYRRLNKDSYIWMEAKKYVDTDNHKAIITLHNNKIFQNNIVSMEQELRNKEKVMLKQYWDMVTLLEAVLNHNNVVDKEYHDDISFYTEQMYRQLQKDYPKYGITDEDIEIVTHLAPIHDIGKVRVPIEILNKPGKLTKEEMDIVKQHPLVGAEMTQRFPKGLTTEKLNQYSYEICRHHHERYDGTGYPDGLKGEDIPLSAQVVGLVDAYDALISVRPYKKKLEHDQAVQMILNGECGKFSDELLHCFKKVSSQNNWIKRSEREDV